jgi:hypothetical protein
VDSINKAPDSILQHQTNDNPEDGHQKIIHKDIKKQRKKSSKTPNRSHIVFMLVANSKKKLSTKQKQ